MIRSKPTKTNPFPAHPLSQFNVKNNNKKINPLLLFTTMTTISRSKAAVNSVTAGFRLPFLTV